MKRKIIAAVLAFTMIISYFPVFAFADSTIWKLTADTVQVDGTEDKTVNVYFQSIAENETFSVQVNWSTTETGDTKYLSLSEFTAVEGYTANSSNLSNGYLYWTDTTFDNPIVTSAGGTIWTATYTVNKDPPAGEYYVTMSGKVTDNTGNTKDCNLTATIMVTEPEPTPEPEETFPYEIYYTLDSTADTETTPDGYKEYDISTDAGKTVTATIKLKNNTATALTLQAYDIYLDYHAGLKYKSHAMTGAVALADGSSTNAAAGAAVTHIEAVSDTYKNSAANKTLPANGELELGTISFTIDTSNTDVKYATPLNIGFKLAEEATNSANKTGITNFSVGSTTGDKKSYYPMLTGDVLGAEVVTTYAVTYNANGGNGGITSATKQYNIPLALEFANIPSREGYTFLGWDESSTATTATYTSTGTSSYTDNKGTILYAVWDQDDFTVTFNANGHGTAPEAAIVKPNEAVEEPAALTATGYTFGGWYTESTCAEENKFDFNTLITENITLYVKWTATPYTITYVLDGGENAVSNPTGYTIESDTITLANPTKEGYTFDAWYTDEACTVKGNTIAAGSIENKTFYAKWNINKYEVSFAKGDHGTLAGTTSQTIEHGAKPTYPTVTPDAGYSFDGWYDGTTKIDTNSYTITGAVTLTAKYTPNPYKVNFDINDGTGTTPESINTKYGDSVEMPSGEGLTKEDYVFAGWSASASATAAEYKAGTSYSNLTTEAEITLYAVWLQDVYKISYSHDPEGVTVTSDLEGTYSSAAGLTINAPTADGYTFKGWTSTALRISEENMSQSATINAGQTGTVDLKAHWDIINYNITYNLDSGTNAASNPATYNVTSETITLADPSKAGYKFEGWYDKAEDGNKVETIAKGSTGDVILYAKWSVIEYKITYDLDSGTNADSNPDKYTVETETITLADPSKTGYTFAGWYDNAEDGNKVETIAKGSVGDVTLYAKWTENQYTIKYDTAGLETIIPDVTVGYDDEVTLPTATKPGYTLTGWSETANTDVGADPQYPINEKVSKLKTGVEGEAEITLYPVWKYAEYTLSFNLGAHPATGAEKPASVLVTYKGTYANLPTVTPATGYNFEGWFVDVNNPNTKIENGGTVEITENTTVTAKYSAIQYTITYNPDNGSATWTDTYTVEDAVTIATAPEKGLYKFVGWTVSTAEGSWADKSLVDAGSTYTEGACYGTIMLTAKWDIPFTYKVEEYKYAYTDYVMLRIATESDGKCYSFGGVNMFYTDDQHYQLEVKVGEDESATTEKRNVFVTLIPEKDGETSLVDGDMKLTEAGMKKLAETTATATKIDRNGDVNGDTVLNIADANVVYQMVINGGGYYSNGDVAGGQLDTYHRLVADMNTAYNEGDYRGTTTDVDWIVKLINGVDPTATTN